MKKIKEPPKPQDEYSDLKDHVIEAQELLVDLSDVQVVTRARELTKAEADIIRLETEIKEYKALKQAEINQLENRKTLLASAIDTSQELQPVNCKIYYDFDLNVAFVHRLDSDTLHDKRPITDMEREKVLQQDLPLGDDNNE